MVGNGTLVMEQLLPAKTPRMHLLHRAYIMCNSWLQLPEVVLTALLNLLPLVRYLWRHSMLPNLAGERRFNLQALQLLLVVCYPHGTGILVTDKLQRFRILLTFIIMQELFLSH